MIKNEKGITIVILIITIVVMLILSAVIIRSADISKNSQNYNKMISDIEVLEDKVSMYYNKYVELPTTGNDITVPTEFPTGTYKEIDLTLLGKVTLNFGNKDNNTEGSMDYYIINNNTHEVFYLEGISLDGKLYYSN